VSLNSFFEELNKFRIKKYPNKRQWIEFIKNPKSVFGKKEWIIFVSSFIILILSGTTFSLNYYYKNTEIKPTQGGVYIEGLIGQPRLINPIYSKASDVDRDISELVFSGLFKYDIDGKIVNDLAENYTISEDGKIYEVKLKKNLFWSDGEPLNADDVVFTIKTIQDPLYKSPLQALWVGIDVEKISDDTIRFALKNPYYPFLELLTQKIAPEHIWKNISPENFPLSSYNLNPIGSGPYKIEEVKQDKEGKINSIKLTLNPKYFNTLPYVSEIIFKFYPNEEKLTKAYLTNEIQGLSLALSDKENQKENFLTYKFTMPRYFVVIFNPDKSKVLSDKNIRQALSYATDKEELVQKNNLSSTDIVYSPFPSNIFGIKDPTEKFEFDLQKAKNILDKLGFVENEQGYREKTTIKQQKSPFNRDLKEGSEGNDVKELQKCLSQDKSIYPDGTISGYFGSKTKEAVIKFQEKYASEILAPSGLKNGTGLVSKTTIKKLEELCFAPQKEITPLKFTLITSNEKILINTANILVEQWKKVGADVAIKTVEVSEIEKNIIKNRDYETLLFGLSTNIIPDPLPFWHSNQIKDPGLNIFNFKNKDADKILEEIRKTKNEEDVKQKLEMLQNIIMQESPAVFLYNPPYFYLVSSNVKGIKEGIIADPSKRFSQINNWYIKTKRIWK
jgi:ABC-type transport system substrate-binding protein